jgi:hypothetical protein
MQKTNLNRAIMFLSIIAATALSCSKQADPVVEPHESIEATFVPKADKLQLTTSLAPMSLLSGQAIALGVNGHMGDAPYIQTTPAKQIQLMKERGLSWYRLNVQTQSDGSASSSTRLEEYQTAASANGVKILPMLYLRTLDFGKSESENYSLGKTLGANFAARYGNYFTYYNLGNDLELKLLYSGKTGQSQLDYDRAKFNRTAAFLKGMDQGIKSKDTDAKTMISAGWLHYGFLRMCEWYGVKFDIVAYNWYADMEAPAANSTNNIPDISLKLASLFPDKPIWFTEFNFRYKTTLTTAQNETEQSNFITKFIAKCKANPAVKVMIMYQLYDEPYKVGAERYYGLIKWSSEYTRMTNKAISNTLIANVR